MRDDFPERTKETLAKRVGMLCSNPSCRKLTSGPRDDPAKALNIGVAAHITAASADGPRFNAGFSSKDRKAIGNAVWLCQNCAKLVDNDEKRYTVDLLTRWKHLAEEAALLSVEGTAASSAAQVSDVELVTFYAQCFDRPAFQDAFRQEGSMEAFDKAMEDTITAINTGCSRLRDGHLVMQTRGKTFLKNVAWRQRMDVIVDLLRWIRSRYTDAVKQRVITTGQENSGMVFYCIHDPEIADWMDNTRAQVLQLFSEICHEAGIAPPHSRLMFERGPVRVPRPRLEAVRPPQSAKSDFRMDSSRDVLNAIVHELQMPLVAIRGAADAIKFSPDIKAKDSYADDIHGWSLLMGRLVDTARSIGREGETFRFEKCLFMRDIYAPALATLTPLLRERNFAPSQIHSPSFAEIPALWLDRRAFQQVMFHLLANAVKYAKQSAADFKTIVKASRDAEHFTISICDWGIGITPEERDEIFRVGFRGRKAAVLDVRGAGFGLTVARKIVEAHEGKLRLTSNQCPTEFTISLPVSLGARPPKS